MKKAKAIIFDAYGTLFDVNSAANSCKKEIGENWESFSNYWRTTQLEYTWLRSLMDRHKDFWTITEDSLDKSMKKFNINLSLKKDLLSLYKKLSTFPEVMDVLKKLKNEKVKLAILSNGTYELLEELIVRNHLENIFDDIFSIEDVKVFKPNSKVYNLPIKRYNFEKDEIFFLSSNTWDVSGAGNFGFNAIWVNRNHSIFDNLDFKPKIEIKNLLELIDIVKIKSN